MQEKMFNRKRDVVDKEQGADAGAGGGKPAAAAKAKKAKGKNINPYASRGLDKFSVVLSELESRREKIMRRVGPDVDADHVMVRFTQSEAKRWVPIVVKLPPEEEPQAAAPAADGKKKKKKSSRPGSQSSTPPPTEPASPKEGPVVAVATAAAAAKATTVPPAKKKSNKARGVRWSLALGRKMVTRPCYYWPLAMVLVLLCLVVFGRVFAICCTSIWWYLLPILSGEEALGGGAGRSPATATKPRKDDVVGIIKVKAGDRVAVAPPASHGKKSSSAGDAREMVSPRSYAHRKKG